MRLEVFRDAHVDVRIVLAPDHLRRDIEHFHHRNSRGVAIEFCEELRRHLRESRAGARLVSEVSVDDLAEEFVVTCSMLVGEALLEHLPLQVHDPAELLRALYDRAREGLQIRGREQLSQFRPLHGGCVGEARIQDDEGGGVLGIIDREIYPHRAG
jgi:hypothetical protein